MCMIKVWGGCVWVGCPVGAAVAAWGQAVGGGGGGAGKAVGGWVAVIGGGYVGGVGWVGA